MKTNCNKNDRNILRPPVLSLHWDVFERIVKTIGFRRAESGGAIGGNGEGLAATHYQFDESSRTSAVTYSPDHKFLNRLFKTDWNPQDIRLRGFVHSHPGRMGSLSYGDKVYADRILRGIEDLDCLWLPIVNTVPDTGMFRLTPWAVYSTERGLSVVKGRIRVVSVPRESSLVIDGVDVVGSIQLGVPLEEIAIGTPATERYASRAFSRDNYSYAKEKNPARVSEGPQEKPNWTHKAQKSFDVRSTFNRVQNAYDLTMMRKARIVAIGAGGAADWLEAMARAGVGQFVMIDPDIVSETNLATQQTYRKDIGRPKVECIAERIRDINPAARTVAVQRNLDDLTENEIRRLVVDSIDGCDAATTVICGLTDSFFAQARVNRLALHLGVPSLCAQVYKEGRGAELTFTYPGVTPACHRCILSSRYRHFLEKGKANDVTSHGTPVFSTTRLNAIKGFLALALIHHKTDHPRWGGMLTRIGKRNLVQIRLDPDFAETVGIRVFDRVFEGADRERLFFDEVIWLPQDQECPDTGYPPCPDCGGTGDLRNAFGRFSDTRLQAKGATTQTKGPIVAMNAG